MIEEQKDDSGSVSLPFGKQTVVGSTVILGDCVAGMIEYPDKYFDLAVVDVPYGIGMSVETSAASFKSEKWKTAKPKGYKAKEWDNKVPDKIYFDELIRISKNQIVWGANHFISMIPIDSPCWLVWDKKNGDNNFADCELALTSFKTAVRKFEWLWNGFQKQRPEERIHQTQKPVALYDWIFINYAKKGDKILDTHLGSGSSRIAADKAGLDFTGYENDIDHYNDQKNVLSSTSHSYE